MFQFSIGDACAISVRPASLARSMFQFSIGDANDAACDDLHCGAEVVSILYWRCRISPTARRDSWR